MARDLTGKRVILTGASGGIGRALAEALVQAGARVALAARQPEAIDELAGKLRQFEGDVVAVPGDITNANDRRRLVRAAVAASARPDILTSNAVVGSWGHFATSSEDIMRRVMEVTFFAPVELTRLPLPHLEHGVGPCVVNVTSMCGRKGMPAWPEY